MRSVSVWRGIGAFVSAVFDAAFILADAIGFGNTPSRTIPWQWYALGTFVVFCGFVVWAWIDHYLEIHRLKDQRPDPEMHNWFAPLSESDGVFFDVANNGAIGVFQIDLEILETDYRGEDASKAPKWPSQPLKMPWQNASSGKIEILHGSSERACVISVDRNNGVFEMVVIAARENKADEFKVARWDSNVARKAPIIRWKITVVSNPAAVTKPKPRYFTLELPNNLTEVFMRKRPRWRRWLIRLAIGT